MCFIVFLFENFTKKVHYAKFICLYINYYAKLLIINKKRSFNMKICCKNTNQCNLICKHCFRAVNEKPHPFGVLT